MNDNQKPVNKLFSQLCWGDEEPYFTFSTFGTNRNSHTLLFMLNGKCVELNMCLMLTDCRCVCLFVCLFVFSQLFFSETMWYIKMLISLLISPCLRNRSHKVDSMKMSPKTCWSVCLAVIYIPRSFKIQRRQWI